MASFLNNDALDTCTSWLRRSLSVTKVISTQQRNRMKLANFVRDPRSDGRASPRKMRSGDMTRRKDMLEDMKRSGDSMRATDEKNSFGPLGQRLIHNPWLLTPLIAATNR